MTGFTNSIVYFFLFLSLYFEVFLLITYFEKRLTLKKDTLNSKKTLKKYPSVTIIVPVWNEESTVSGTIHSLLHLDYPKDKLKIMIVDDGSTDNTWEVIKKFENKKQIEIYRKENGGKHTAVNFGLSKMTTDLFGCLDADSYVHKDALKNIITYFEDKETMAVTPSVVVWKPKTIIQLIQKVEYSWGILIRKMLSYMGALYVTPGPFSIFRKEVFEKLGGYKHAYLTEDMEMAMRMQMNHYKIANSHDAYVYTVAPDSLLKLYKQRIRWTYGFIKNVIDYKHLFFKKEYGNLGVFILPIASISILSAIYLLGVSVFSIGSSLITQYIKISTVGMHWETFNFDLFYINTQVITIASLVAFLGTLTILYISKKLAEGEFTLGMDMVYFVTMYAFIAPLWMTKSLYNVIFSIKTKWR